MSDIKILPIFDQSEPSVWEDFLRIRSAATCYSCGYSMSMSDLDYAKKELERGWIKRGFNFAFGAYDDFKMVGFINGDCVDQVSTVRGLYVLPDYMGNKLGGRLLKSAEQISTFGAKSMDLISLPKSQKFYEHHGYVPILWGSNHYEKTVKCDVRGKTLPVFRVTSKIAKSCSNISAGYNCSFDAKSINKLHIPMYVYLDCMSDVRGFIIERSNDADEISEEIYISPHQPSKFISSCLNKEVNHLRQLQLAKKEHSR